MIVIVFIADICTFRNDTLTIQIGDLVNEEELGLYYQLIHIQMKSTIN